jgi:hypothetical protein
MTDEQKAELNTALAKAMGYRVKKCKYGLIHGWVWKTYHEDREVGCFQLSSDEAFKKNAPRYTESMDACCALADANGWDVRITPYAGGCSVFICTCLKTHGATNPSRTVAFALALAKALGIDPGSTAREGVTHE